MRETGHKSRRRFGEGETDALSKDLWHNENARWRIVDSQGVAERIKRLVALANTSNQQTVEVPVHIAEQWVAILEAEAR